MSDQQYSGHVDRTRASWIDANERLSAWKLGKPSTHSPHAGALAAFSGGFARFPDQNAPT